MDDNLFGMVNPGFWGIMLRFIINLIFLFILIRLIYYRYTQKERYLFSFFVLGTVSFFVAILLRSIYLETTLAVGLFAIFSILRFRTRNVSIKDMTYIFTTIAISVISSLVLLRFPEGTLIINAIIILGAYLLEEFQARNRSESYIIIYENIDLLRADKKDKLMKDLCTLTGKNVLRYKIIRVNYRRKIARLELFCKD
jgi:hypothetical protein